MELSEDKVRTMVREQYGRVAQSSGCGDSCCSGSCSSSFVNIADLGRKLDYSDEELALGKGEANLGLGCGNPLSVAGIQPGEYIVDLGCGAGFDAFLAAKQVGNDGRVIGVDMTPEIEKAKANAEKFAVRNVVRKLKNCRLPKTQSSEIIQSWNIGVNTENVVFSVYIKAFKPKQ